MGRTASTKLGTLQIVWKKSSLRAAAGLAEEGAKFSFMVFRGLPAGLSSTTSAGSGVARRSGDVPAAANYVVLVVLRGSAV